MRRWRRSWTKINPRPRPVRGVELAIEYITNQAAIFEEVLDRVLDKGIVIDPWIRVSVSGIDLLTSNVRLVVASSEIL